MSRDSRRLGLRLLRRRDTILTRDATSLGLRLLGLRRGLLCSLCTFTVLHDPEPLPSRQRSTDLDLILGQTSGKIDLLSCLTGRTSTHVCGSCGREQRDVRQVVDSLLPFLTGLIGWVNKLDVLGLDLVDHISDPAALDFNACRAV